MDTMYFLFQLRNKLDTLFYLLTYLHNHTASTEWFFGFFTHLFDNIPDLNQFLINPIYFSRLILLFFVFVISQNHHVMWSLIIRF